jgi:hypothetical protein
MKDELRGDFARQTSRYAELSRNLQYVMHELPAGVLWGADAATESQCSELMRDLDEFEGLAKAIGRSETAFIEACRWHLEHYPHYLSRRRHFSGYEEYIHGRKGPKRVPAQQADAAEASAAAGQSISPRGRRGRQSPG